MNYIIKNTLPYSLLALVLFQAACKTSPSGKFQKEDIVYVVKPVTPFNEDYMGLLDILEQMRDYYDQEPDYSILEQYSDEYGKEDIKLILNKAHLELRKFIRAWFDKAVAVSAGLHPFDEFINDILDRILFIIETQQERASICIESLEFRPFFSQKLAALLTDQYETGGQKLGDTTESMSVVLIKHHYLLLKESFKIAKKNNLHDLSDKTLEKLRSHAHLHPILKNEDVFMPTYDFEKYHLIVEAILFDKTPAGKKLRDRLEIWPDNTLRDAPNLISKVIFLRGMVLTIKVLEGRSKLVREEIEKYIKAKLSDTTAEVDFLKRPKEQKTLLTVEDLMADLGFEVNSPNAPSEKDPKVNYKRANNKLFRPKGNKKKLNLNNKHRKKPALPHTPEISAEKELILPLPIANTLSVDGLPITQEEEIENINALVISNIPVEEKTLITDPPSHPVTLTSLPTLTPPAPITSHEKLAKVQPIYKTPLNREQKKPIKRSTSKEDLLSKDKKGPTPIPTTFQRKAANVVNDKNAKQKRVPGPTKTPSLIANTTSTIEKREVQHIFELPAGIRKFQNNFMKDAHPVELYPKHQEIIDNTFDPAMIGKLTYKNFKLVWQANGGDFKKSNGGSHRTAQYPRDKNLFGIYVPHGGHTTYGSASIKYIQTLLLYRGLRPTEWLLKG